MINLLPQHTHRNAVLEYRLRLLAVIGFALAGLSAMLAALLMPAYFFAEVAQTQSRNEEKAVDASLSGTQDADLAAQEKATAILFAAVGKERLYPRPSEAIDAALSATHPGVALQRIEYTFTSDGMSLRLSGIALTRDNLLAFKQTLSAVPGISGVMIPLASLALSNNLPFSVSLSYITPLTVASSTFGSVATTSTASGAGAPKK